MSSGKQEDVLTIRVNYQALKDRLAAQEVGLYVAMFSSAAAMIACAVFAVMFPRNRSALLIGAAGFVVMTVTFALVFAKNKQQSKSTSEKLERIAVGVDESVNTACPIGFVLNSGGMCTNEANIYTVAVTADAMNAGSRLNDVRPRGSAGAAVTHSHPWETDRTS